MIINEHDCVICETQRDDQVFSKCSSCNKFICHQQCFTDVYTFSSCPFCFSKINHPPLTISVHFSDFSSSCEKLEQFTKLKNIIQKNMNTLNTSFNYHAWTDSGFGQTITVRIPRTGELWECAEINEDEIDELKQEIKNLLSVAQSLLGA